MNVLWSVIFVEYWKHQELDLAIRWGVKGVSSIEEKRPDFRHEKEVKDPVTGEMVQFFPATKRLARQALQIPFALLASLALGSLIATCFGIEIFLSEVYSGPFKGVLVSLSNESLLSIALRHVGILAHGPSHSFCSNTDNPLDGSCHKT